MTAHGFVLQPPHLRVGGLRGRFEVMARAGVVPAARLHAAHGHDGLAAGGDQDRDVEGAVLLGAKHLLALEHENVVTARVLDDQIPDRTAPGKFLDGEALADRFFQGDVGLLRGRTEDRVYGQGTGFDGVTERER